MRLFRPEGERAQRRLVIGLAVTIVLVGVAAVVAYLAMRQSPSPDPAAAYPSTADYRSLTPSPDVTWQPAVGVDLPVSRTHGPRSIDSTTATAFSASEFGAALAAVHILIRSSANAGPQVYEPTITQQVVGVNVAAMKLSADRQYEQLRASAGVPAGEPVVDADAQVLGYRVAAFDSGSTAAVEVYVTSPALQAGGQVVRFDVQLQRADGDWKVVAPPRGDWSEAATTLSAEPDGLLRYDQDT